MSFRNGKLRSVLVVSEMALALILVTGAALLIHAFTKLQAVDPGFDTRNVLTMAMSISGNRFQKTAGVAQVIRDGTERLKAVPGVKDAAAGVACRCRVVLVCRLTSWEGRRVMRRLRVMEAITLCRGATSTL
jgi:hypothetical protein